jgi:ethanolamine phosphate transferase 2 subunit G
MVESDHDFTSIFLGFFLIVVSLVFFGWKFANPLDAVMIIYSVSQFSSSFIEEEYMIWFFALQTVLFLRIRDLSSFKLLASMAIVRFLFTANPNGYLSVDEFTVKKLSSESPSLQSILLIISLTYFSASNNNSHLELLFKILLSVATLLYHIHPALHTVLFARLCLSSSLACMVLLDPWFASKMIAVLLSKSHNSLVLMMLEVLKNWIGDSSLTHTLLLHFSFFATGSSHLISSIDLPNAYIWLYSFTPALVGISLFLLTWIGPISLAFPRNGQFLKKSASPFGRIFVFLILAISAVLQRYHLFVWTVFTPRILFEVFWILFYCLFVWFPKAGAVVWRVEKLQHP